MVLDFASHRSVVLSVFDQHDNKWTIFVSSKASGEENYWLIRDITARMRETGEKARVVKI